eukprot:TRINITY_DN16404_c0_g1_i1.p1 TRINITY_DN16404_c0_g1~~TRINITY_DN16404_c0_g1_i1.p1  ORF type:complete len:395 (+),score=80.61 TRINITY_DN16404_c0_g1_i1:106-1185(+)
MVWEDAAANVAFQVEGWNDLPEVAFISRSFTGKSYLLRKLFSPRLKIAQISSEPGNKNQMNFYRIADSLRLIETPGFGYTAETLKVQQQWQAATLALYKTRPNMKHLYLLVNPKFRGITERDRSMVEFLNMYKIPFTIVVTRADRILDGRLVKELREMEQEERYEVLLKYINEMKKAADAPDVPVIVTSAAKGEGLGQLIYDIVARAFADVPTKSLYMENVTQRRAPTPQPPTAPDDFTSLITQTTWLPPAGLPSGFFYAPTTDIAKKLPKREGSSLAMLTPEDEAARDEDHPLKGNPLLVKYFPTLAETYLRKNHASLNPLVKPKAERYFGMPLPTELHMKYSTPEEKEKWRKLLNKP